MASHSSTFCPIMTVVVLGWMKALNPEIDGVTGTESNPLSTSDPNSKRIFFSDQSVYVDPDPGHELEDTFEQVFGVPCSQDMASKTLQPTMQGFAQNAEKIKKGMSDVVMNGFKRDAVQIYKLVSEFAVCHRWFSSVPASTEPNRAFVHSATSHCATSKDTMTLVQGFPQKTIFESMDEAGYSFGIYFQNLQPPPTTFFRCLSSLSFFNSIMLFLDCSMNIHGDVESCLFSFTVILVYIRSDLQRRC